MVNAKSVFISYARHGAVEHARAFHGALGGEAGDAFLDTADLDIGEIFPRALAEAVLNARVIVVFADEQYFTRWYCLRELRTALSPYYALIHTQPDSRVAICEALDQIVLALPSNSIPAALSSLPPPIQSVNWPQLGQTAELAGLVRRRLSRIPRSIRDRFDVLGAKHVVDSFCEEAAIPVPGNLSDIPVYDPSGSVRCSIADRFVGRSDELARIDFALSTVRGQPGNCAAPALKLTAGGGYGKTVVASEYLQRYGPRHYSGGLFWIDATADQSSLESQHYEILCRLRHGSHVYPDLATMRQNGANIRGLLADALKQLPPTPAVLFVIDNIPETKPGEPAHLLSEYCPAVGLVPVLATSRQRTAEPGVAEMRLDILSRSASVLLLTNALDSRHELSEQEWDLLADWLGDLPLALDLLNRAFWFNAVTPRSILQRRLTVSVTEELDSQRKGLFNQVGGAPVRGAIEAFSVSYERLAQSAQRTIAVLARLGPVHIPESIMQALGSEMNTPTVRTLLTGRHLVTGPSPGHFGKIHPLLGDYLRRVNLVTAEKDLSVACNAFLSGAATEVVGRPEDIPRVNVFRQHGEFLYNQIRTAEDVPSLLLSARIALALSELCAEQYDIRSAREFAAAAYEGFRDGAGEGATETTYAMGSFANTLNEAGDYAEALELQKVLVEHLAVSLGSNDPTLLSAQSQLASIYRNKGDLNSARSLQEQVLEGQRFRNTDGAADELAAIGDLAVTLFQLGHLEKAQLFLEEVIEKYLRSTDCEAANLFRFSNNLAQVYRLQGHLKEAHEVLDLLVRDIVQLRGEQHPESLFAKHNLAGILMRLGQFEEALRIEEAVVDVLEQIFGSGHSHTLNAKNIFGEIQRGLGDLSGARIVQESVLKERTRVLGEEHPDTLISMNNLAGTLCQQGNVAGGQELQKQMIEIQERILGADHPDVLNSRLNLASNLGDDVEAQRSIEMCLANNRRVLGEEHPYTLAAINNLAMCLARQGNRAGARELLEELVSRGPRILGRDSPPITAAFDELAGILFSQGDFDAAFETGRRFLGEEHPKVIDLAEALGGFLFLEKHSIESARPLQEMVLEKRISTRGTQDPDTIRSAENLSLLLLAAGDQDALRRLRKRFDGNLSPH